MCVLVLVVATPLPIQFPGNLYGKAAEDGLSAWASTPNWEDWKKLQLVGFAWPGPSC